MCKINCSGGCPKCSPEDHKKTPHKHAAAIKAWADGGVVIQWRKCSGDAWEDTRNPLWVLDYEYRIKPEPKPDVVVYSRMTWGGEFDTKLEPKKGHNMKSTFDGETGELKSVVLFQYVGE